MKNAFKIICCSLLMFSVNNSIYSSDNSSKDITMDIPSYRKDTLSKFIYKSIEEQNEIIGNLYNNIRENK